MSPVVCKYVATTASNLPVIKKGFAAAALAIMTLAGALLPTAASATYLRYDYTATVNNTTSINNNGTVVVFNQGDTLNGEFRIEANAPSTLSWFNDRMTYNGALDGFSVNGTGINVAANGNAGVIVDNNRRLTSRGTAWEDMFVGSLNTSNANIDVTALGGGVTSLGFNFWTTLLYSAPTVLLSHALPGETQLLNFPFNQLSVSFQDTSSLLAMFKQISVTPVGSGNVQSQSQSGSNAAIPEPETVMLLALGLMGIGLSRRKKHTSLAV